MNGDTDNQSNEQNGGDERNDVPPDETPAVSKEDDNVGDISVEINVEELVARIESADANADATDKDHDVRKKLDEISQKKKDDLDSTYNFNIDDDL